VDVAGGSAGGEYKVISGLGQALASAMARVARIDATRKLGLDQHRREGTGARLL